VSAATVHALVEDAAAAATDAVYATSADGASAPLTFGTLAADCRAIGAALDAAGVGRRETVSTVMGNGLATMRVLLGAMHAGRRVNPVNLLSGEEQMRHVIGHADARLVVAAPEWEERVRAVVAALEAPVRVVVVGVDAGVDEIVAAIAPSARPTPASRETEAPRPDDTALLMYTSGTTGLPKGVMLSHRNILAGRREAVREQMKWNEWQEDDVNLVALPVGHIGGIGWAIVGFLNGAHTIVQREFVPAQVLEAIERQRVSKMFLVPTALHMLLLQPRVREIDYSRMRHILYGASPIALDLLREATEVFGCGFCQQYGMTETCGTIVYLPPEDHDPAGNKRMRGAGIPMPGVEIRVVDAITRAPLPAGQIGEVETRSVANMVGYWNRPDATAETISAEGWLRTGDAGYLDEAGYLYIQDRFKDMICSGAENVYPAEVENAVFGHPAVQEVAVIGVPDDKWGEAVKAMVVLKPGAEPDAEAILSFARTRLAGFKVPKSVDFVAALPRGPSGKILRRILREPYWAGRERRVN